MQNSQRLKAASYFPEKFYHRYASNCNIQSVSFSPTVFSFALNCTSLRVQQHCMEYFPQVSTSMQVDISQWIVEILDHTIMFYAKFTM